MTEVRECLRATAYRIADSRERVADSRVSPTATLGEVVAGFDVPRYFGFVTGGSLDADRSVHAMLAAHSSLIGREGAAPAR
jgi:hypothetical protein